MPEELPWPDLNKATIEKLANFPIWDYAVYTERQVFNKLRLRIQTRNRPSVKGGACSASL